MQSFDDEKEVIRQNIEGVTLCKDGNKCYMVVGADRKTAQRIELSQRLFEYFKRNPLK